MKKITLEILQLPTPFAIAWYYNFRFVPSASTSLGLRGIVDGIDASVAVEQTVVDGARLSPFAGG